MPIDPRELAGAGGKRSFTEVVETDRPCSKCRYNLKGLPINGRCPECGYPVSRRGLRGSKRFSDNLTDAPLFYLKTLAFGAVLLACGSGSLGVLLLLETSRKVRNWQHWPDAALAICGLAAVAWWTGVFICTAQRPMGDGTLPDVFLDSVRLRWVNRVSQALWAGAVFGLFASMRLPPPGTDIAAWATLAFLVLALFGLVPLSIQLSSLADWAGDSGIAERFRITASGITICGVLWLGGWIAEVTGWTHWTSYLIRIPANWSVLGLCVAVGVFLFTLYQLAHISLWAISNSVTQAETQRRLVEREYEKQREMAERSATASAMAQHGARFPAGKPSKTAFPRNVMDAAPESGYSLEPEGPTKG